jgi:D-hydroxyproline dehydrogenase subunit gamma
MPEPLRIKVDGVVIETAPGTTLSAALLASGRMATRRSLSGSLRGPLCGMGICHECRVRVDGVAHMRGCQTLCRDGMEVELD